MHAPTTMEKGTANPKLSLPQSAYTRAYAAAEPGHFWSNQPGRSCRELPISADTSHSGDSPRSFGREHISIAEIAGNGRNAVPTIFEDYSLGQSVPTSFVDEQIGDLTNLDCALFAQNTRVSPVDYGHYNAYGSLATPGNCTNANPWATAHSYIDAFAPFVTSDPSRLTESAFATGTAYNDGIALPTAPNSYTWEPAVAQGPMDQYIGAGFPFPDPPLSMMSPFAADTNGNGYQGHFPANSFDTQARTAVDFPKASHAVDSNAIPFGSDATSFDMAQCAPPRPTCAACNQSFGRQADLHRHAKIHQAGSKTFCPVAGCGYGSYRKDKLDEHVRRRHRALGAVGTRV